MSRVSMLLLAVLVLSALMLVRTSHESRKLFTALDRARLEGQALETEHQRLLAERQAQGTNLRVEKVARERLRMRNASAAVTHYVIDPAAPGASR